MSFSGRTIVVSVLAWTMTVGLNSTLGYAATTQAEQAMGFLSKSMAVDSKCNFLSASEHDELSALVARAEIALATQSSVEAAKAALNVGRSAGNKTNCDDNARAEINNILAAARTAAAQAPVAKPVVKVSAVKPMTIMRAKPAPVEAGKMAVNKTIMQPSRPKLFGYASLTERYYVARRCGTMSAPAINALYQDVLISHRESLRVFGKGAVASAMRNSEARAKSQICN